MNRAPFAPVLVARLADNPCLSRRLAGFYAQLRQLPRAARRRLRRAGLSLAGAALLLALGAPPVGRAAPAATIDVANGMVVVADEGLCSLIEAIDNANDDGDGEVHDDCVAGNPDGPDTVSLPAAGAFTLTSAAGDDYGATGLPLITSTITIAGNGATLQRAGNEDLRFLAVAGGELTLETLTLSAGRLPDYYGGAIYIRDSDLTLTGVTLTGNRADRGGAVAALGSEVSVSGSTLRDNDSDLGGAIYCDECALTLQTSTISGNDSGAGSGGGIYAQGGVVTLDETTLRQNAGYSGGGIAALAAEVALTDLSLIHISEPTRPY